MRAPKTRAKILGHFVGKQHMTSSFSNSRRGQLLPSPSLQRPWLPSTECPRPPVSSVLPRDIHLWADLNCWVSCKSAVRAHIHVVGGLQVYGLIGDEPVQNRFQNDTVWLLFGWKPQFFVKNYFCKKNFKNREPLSFSL